MNQNIRCTVADCHYWASGNMCAANQILVTTDNVAAVAPPQIDANMAHAIAPTAAGLSMATACKTYVQRGSNQALANNVVGISNSGFRFI
ncbi:protein of unknown function DUF1540 [Desulfofarcimen acetoxidans DSM 771]|uniref:DUF1540 domain-containing protein n=1 Tax=Desulfofarcimen acetoxidans (strain ATCC 49208 / DSM 771 / KCTC 5769 / VKM B-1644 / 5575) TaxID=485916 RepID=C8W5U7_DESAS|nr:DUF1540 domain-containing protein [Desulfofarcimen acetoxidans]ACV64097.1 protein of unknown function DUF1540 [Desulfofarcimen acetoxidans DSM 771]